MSDSVSLDNLAEFFKDSTFLDIKKFCKLNKRNEKICTKLVDKIGKLRHGNEWEDFRNRFVYKFEYLSQQGPETFETEPVNALQSFEITKLMYELWSSETKQVQFNFGRLGKVLFSLALTINGLRVTLFEDPEEQIFFKKLDFKKFQNRYEANIPIPNGKKDVERQVFRMMNALFKFMGIYYYEKGATHLHEKSSLIRTKCCSNRLCSGINNSLFQVEGQEDIFFCGENCQIQHYHLNKK